MIGGLSGSDTLGLPRPPPRSPWSRARRRRSRTATPNECPNGGWHVLQFKNGCTGGEKTVNVCVKWTSGASNGLVARMFSFSNGGGVAELHPGLCENGAISYNWRNDGEVPDCPN